MAAGHDDKISYQPKSRFIALPVRKAKSECTKPRKGVIYNNQSYRRILCQYFSIKIRARIRGRETGKTCSRLARVENSERSDIDFASSK